MAYTAPNIALPVTLVPASARQRAASVMRSSRAAAVPLPSPRAWAWASTTGGALGRVFIAAPAPAG